MKIQSTFSKAILALLMSATCASADIIISIDQTGANIPISMDAPRVWNITLTGTGTFDSALFAAKRGGDTTTSLDFSVYSGFNGTFGDDAAGRLIYSTSIASVDISKSSYQTENFSLGDLVLGPGNYSLELSSAATGGGTDQYFIKSGSNGGALTFTDTTTGTTASIVQQGGNNVTNATTSSAPVAPVPEPSSVVLGAGVGMLLLIGGSIRGRRRNANVAVLPLAA